MKVKLLYTVFPCLLLALTCDMGLVARSQEQDMAAVQEEKRNVSNQIEDVKEMIPMLKELSDDEKIYIKGMLAGFQTMRQLGIKTA